MEFFFRTNLFPTLFLALMSIPAAAALRLTVQKEYPSLLPWLNVWGLLCTLPALALAVLCLPSFADEAAWLNEAIAGTRLEILAGIAGVLPGLLWEDAAERIGRGRPPLFGLPAPLLCVLSIAVITVLLLIPYGFLFPRGNAGTSAAEPAVPAQTETVSDSAPAQSEPTQEPAVPAQTETVPDNVPAQTEPAAE